MTGPTTEQAFRAAIAAHAGGMARLRPSRRAEAAADLHAAVVAAHREIVEARDRQHEREMLAARRERDEARETAADLATAWDRERETLAAHIGALEGERDKAVKLAEALRLARRNDIRAHDAEMAEARQRVDDVRIAIVDITAERDRLREQLAAREAGRPPFHADPGSGLVCSACGTEACANGVLMCDEAKTASFVHRPPAVQTPAEDMETEGGVDG